jgi:dTDP-4-dehydrorhamnose reductase
MMTSPARRKPGTILLIGATGQIGWELQRALASLGPVKAPGRDRLDLADRDQLRRCVRDIVPDLVINAAAYTDVDGAEANEDLAMAVNAEAPGILAEEARRLDIPLVHYSTDYVFGGVPAAASENRPYREDDPTSPINTYGRSKLAGERAIQAVAGPHLIFRTSWIYAARGSNFLRTMQRLARDRDELRVVEDQTGAPTWARMVAEATLQALARCWAPGDADPLSGSGGLYHLSATGQATWHAFAEAILRHALEADDRNVRARRVVPIPSSAFPRPARRPAYSVLDNSAVCEAFDIRLPHWHSQLDLCLQE